MSENLIIALLGYAGTVSIALIAGYFGLKNIIKKHNLEREAIKEDLKIAQKVKEYRKYRKEAVTRSIETLRELGEIPNYMDNIKSLGIDRILTLAITNDGKIPKPGSKLYVSSLDVSGLTKEIEMDIKSRYKKTEVDGDYAKMCHDLIVNKDIPGYKYHVKVPEEAFEAKEKGEHYKGKLNILQYFYLSEGIKESYIYKLSLKAQYNEEKKKDSFALFIISVAIYRDNEKSLDDIDKGGLHTNIGAIKHIFRKYYGYEITEIL